jgi:GT2 family glycosyltransferase
LLERNSKVTIIVVHYGDLEDTWRCLESLAHLPFDDHQVLVVDNGSAPAVAREIARRYPKVQVLRRERNGGWAGGNNTGVRYALEHGAERLVLLNNDTTVTPDLLDVLLQAAREAPEYGILGPVINFMDEPDQVRTDGCVFDRSGRNGFFRRKEVPLASAPAALITEVDIVNGCCMMVEARVFRTIGLIDERFFLVHEESDLCLRARQAGFRCGVIGRPLVWHKGSSSFATTGKRLQRYYDARNLYLLLRRHAKPTGRGPWGFLDPSRSRLAYLKYVYYRYCIEREQRRDETALAALEGLWDAAAGHYGAFVPRHRPGLTVLQSVLEWWRQRRLRSPRESIARASAVH